MTNITFILGGVRSGKSRYAEQLAECAAHPKIYLATAEPLDSEMAARISAHRKRRGEGWKTLEIPVEIADAIAAHEGVIVVDCLTLWLSNLMHKNLDILDYTQQLVSALQATKAAVILVSNEVGQGIIPSNALARQFCDEAGMLHQRMAEVATRVIFMIAGIATIIKG